MSAKGTPPNAKGGPEASPLGRRTTYPEGYDAGLLFPVERAPQRALLGFAGGVPFRGADLWTAYELSWLDAAGTPQVAIASFVVPAASPRLVESKSVKLYLTALNQSRFASPAEVGATLARDLSEATGARVDVALTPAAEFAAMSSAELDGECLDDLAIAADRDAPAPELLVASGAPCSQTLFTRLFRSVCPVTGQPDYASLRIACRGPRIDRAGLLRYLLAYRRHPGFHEHCVERIFADLWRRCAPEALSVYARFTRRGGVDINPYRTSGGEPPPPNVPTARQ
jgi:7-cyano-7-deazaguanine reductase